MNTLRQSKEMPVSIILNTHIPLSDRPWAYEALFHCYLPLFSQLKNYRITMGLSPQLIDCFTDPNFPKQCRAWVKTVLDKVNKIEHKPLRNYYKKYYLDHLDILEQCDFNLADLWSNNKWEILAYPASHAILPLLPQKLVHFLLDEGEQKLNRFFGNSKFSGIWLPEMAFEDGPNNLLYSLAERYKYIFGNWRLANSDVECNSTCRDQATTLSIVLRNIAWQRFLWDRESSFTKDNLFRESFEQDSHGNKHLSIGGAPYDPDKASKQLKKSLADSLLVLSQEQGETISIMFDTEFFGHHWWEGKEYLPMLAEALGDRLVYASTLAKNSKREIDLRGKSYSWGTLGDQRSEGTLEPWVNGGTTVFLQLYRELFLHMANWPDDKLRQNSVLINQFLSSDWLFNIVNPVADLHDRSFRTTFHAAGMLYSSYKALVRL